MPLAQRGPVPVLALLLPLAACGGEGGAPEGAAASAASALAAAAPAAGSFELVEEIPTPGLETELSGIYPHPTRDDLYFVVTNGRPTYKPTMTPMLPPEQRNKLLTVNREGKVVEVDDLPDGGGLFGDLAFGDGHLWLAPLDPPRLWKYDLATRRVVAEYPLPGPAGGLDFDRDRSLIVVQSYIGHPHLALVDSRTGAIVGSVWSDENAQGMAKVEGDWLTVWSSSWDPDAYTELWHLDQESGRPLSRRRLEGIHAAMAPLDPRVAGYTGFMTLVHTGSGVTGETVIRRFRYDPHPRRTASAGGAAARE